MTHTYDETKPMQVEPLFDSRGELSERGQAKVADLKRRGLIAYCICGSVAPYDHRLGCTHAVYPTPAPVGCMICEAYSAARKSERDA